MTTNIRLQIPRILGASFIAALLVGTAGAVGAQAAPQSASTVQNLNQGGGDAGQGGGGNGGLNQDYGDVNQGGSGGSLNPDYGSDNVSMNGPPPPKDRIRQGHHAPNLNLPPDWITSHPPVPETDS
ncbi:hypothetical protein ABZ471_02485 [Streptomyces sp. NPDC005728]|uniref:hypothetical protein n=1 Tax=Streptomyces sp. NPDC005728 TaxID=3157054 RepID=UPI003406D285